MNILLVVHNNLIITKMNHDKVEEDVRLNKVK